MKHQLSRTEIKQLAEEYRALERWEQVRHNALTLCGEQAHKVEVIVKNIYTYSYYVICVYCIIYDHDNRKLLASEQPAYPVTNFRLRAKYRATLEHTKDTPVDQNGNNLIPLEYYIPDDDHDTEPPDNYIPDDDHDTEPPDNYIPDDDDYDVEPPEDYIPDEMIDEQDIEFSENYVYLDKITENTHALTVIFPALKATYLLDNPPTISFPAVYTEQANTELRRLTREEILQLDKEYDALEQWSQVNQTIRQAYEKTAYKAIICTMYAYLDECNPNGGYYVQVLDKEDSPVLPDLNTKYWDTTFFTGWDQEEWIEIATHINFGMFKGIEIADGEYILDSPPSISFPEVYVEK